MEAAGTSMKQAYAWKRSLVAGVLVLLAVFLSFAAGDAQAARVHQLEISETLPNNEALFSVAVNSTTHHIYVGGHSTDGSGHVAVYNLDENAQPDPLHPELTGASAFEPFSIAVDNSGGAHAGDIYVVSLATLENPEANVQQFNPGGEATAVRVTKSAIPANGTPQAGGLPPVVNDGNFSPRDVAVDGSGNVFVTDSSARAIDVFSPAGVFLRQIGSALSVGFPNIAIDWSNLYVAIPGEQNDGALSPGLTELDAATGECVQVGCAPIDTTPSIAVAVDRAAGTIFTTGFTGATEYQGRLNEYDASSGALIGTTQAAALRTPGAVAVDEASGRVIVADSIDRTVEIFGPVEIVPDVKTLAPEDRTDHSVTLKGEIGAADVPSATCTFQYVDAAAFQAHGFEGAAEAPCEENGEPAGPYSGSEVHDVEAKVSGLKGGTTYHQRILGENENGSNPGEDIPFRTKGPAVNGTEVVEVGADEATLKAEVDPDAAQTTYRFQYLTQAQFETSGWSGADEIPMSGEAIGAGTEPIAVSERIEGLAPATEYRFRVLAVSSGGESEGETGGEEITFTTFALPVTGLPDGRRYEQASPTEKNGANIQGGKDSVQASPGGSRVTFLVQAGIPGGEGAQVFPTFLASRAPDSSGWSTQGLLPPATFGPQAAVVGWSEDLNDTYDFASKPFEGGKLLLRSNTTAALTVVGTNTSRGNPFSYAGASEGGAVALLESGNGGLLPEALENKQNVYVYGRETGTVAVAGVMNDGSVPPGGAMAGPYDWFKSGSTDVAGGALGSYYTQPTHAISADGTHVFFTAAGTGQLYVRINPLGESQELAPAECREPTNEKACTVRVSAPEEGVTDPGTPAAFLGASADGRLVYFLDKGKLTADSTAGAGSDLYRYDVQSGALFDLTVDAADKKGARVEGMLGISGPAGEDAYFVAPGKLAAVATQAPTGQTNLYALHGTAIEFITRLGTSQGEEGEDLDWIPTSRQASGNHAAHAARLSANGQTLLFRSVRKLTGYDNRGVAELYLYRTGVGIACISCNPTGEAPAGPAGVQQIPQLGFTLPRTNPIMTRNLSADGQRVFFDSLDRLLAADRNDVNDVYEWEAKGKGSCAEEAVAGGCLYLVSGGAEGTGPSYFGDADREGENVFFFTPQPLVAQDRDELVDVYDARVGGGIAAQEEGPMAPCEGEAGCRGAAPSPPTPPSPGSTSFTGPGNPKPTVRCRKGKVRKSGRCVAKHKQHKRHKHTSRHGRGKGGRR